MYQHNDRPPLFTARAGSEGGCAADDRHNQGQSHALRPFPRQPEVPQLGSGAEELRAATRPLAKQSRSLDEGVALLGRELAERAREDAEAARNDSRNGADPPPSA